MKQAFKEIHSNYLVIIQMPAEEKMKPYVLGKHLSFFFEGVESTLQLLHLLLCRVVFSHIGTLCGNGLQRTAVTQYFLIEKLERKENP